MKHAPPPISVSESGTSALDVAPLIVLLAHKPFGSATVPGRTSPDLLRAVAGPGPAERGAEVPGEADDGEAVAGGRPAPELDQTSEIVSEMELTPDEEAELEPVFEALKEWIERVERLAANLGVPANPDLWGEECTT